MAVRVMRSRPFNRRAAHRGPLHWGVVTGVVSAAALLVLSAASARRPTPAGPPAGLRVVFGGELNGYLVPCGCSRPMLGGLPRLGRWLDGLPDAGSIVRVEGGDLVAGVGRQDEMKAETIVDALGALGYDAVCPGERDWRLGTAFLRSLAARFRGAFVCANVSGPDGKAVLREYAVVTKRVAGRDVRVVLVGVMSDRYAAALGTGEPGVTVEPSARCLSRLQQAIAKAGEVRVLLYHGPEAEATSLARRFPIFQMVVCAHAGDLPAERQRAGASLVAAGGADGKYAALASVSGPPSWSVRSVVSVPLGEDLADLPGIARIREAYLERVAAEDLLGQVARLPTADGDTFAGSSACAGCHAAAHAAWKTSGHARALASLAAVGEDRDPECVRCHVVGLERVGGFVSRGQTPELAAVGCESCHGPAARHARRPGSAAMPKVGAAACEDCHTPQQSPRFAFDAYWAKVRH